MIAISPKQIDAYEAELARQKLKASGHEVIALVWACWFIEFIVITIFKLIGV